MADLLRQGAQWLEQMRTSHCSSPVTYRRDGEADVIVAATYGRTEYQGVDESGLTVAGHVIDFLINRDALAGIPGAPEPGDLIIADGRQYEVVPLGEDFKGWRWSDPYRTTYRIHTRDIGTAT